MNRGRAVGLLALGLATIGLGHAASPPLAARPAEAPAPPVTLAGTRVESLTSAINGVEYLLDIGLPAGFRDDGTNTYPLLVLLDADYSFPIARSVVTHLSDRGDLPHLIVAAVAYAGPPAYRLHRTRDYTPTRMLEGGYGPEIQRHSGGGPQFAEVLAREILPRLRERYRATGTRVLVGHSYGGLFGAWALLERPGLFDGYILVSPSLWYDDGVLFRREAALPPTARMALARVYAATGALEINAEHDMPADLRRFGTRLTRERWPQIEIRHEILDDETHNSVYPRALSNGLRFHWPRGGAARGPAPPSPR